MKLPILHVAFYKQFINFITCNFSLRWVVARPLIVGPMGIGIWDSCKLQQCKLYNYHLYSFNNWTLILWGYWFIGVHITQVFSQYVYGFPKLVNLQFALCFWNCDLKKKTFVVWDCNSCLQFVCDFLIPWCLIAIVCSLNLYWLWCGIFWLFTSTILLAFSLE